MFRSLNITRFAIARSTVLRDKLQAGASPADLKKGNREHLPYTLPFCHVERSRGISDYLT
jgi:hypothetical protein